MKTIIKKNITILLIGGMVLGPLACKDEFLEVPVTGQLTEDQILSPQGMEGLLIGTYSVLNGRENGWFGGASNWLWGSIRGGDANKGSNAGDFNTMTPNQNFTSLNPVNPEPDRKWSGSFEGVARANSLLYSLEKVEGLAADVKTRIEAEARFLRGHYYFELKKTFGNVPWVDETTNYEAARADKEIADKKSIPNNVDIWPNIEADFQFAFDNLPETHAQVGRANKWAAAAYLGKTYLYQKKYAEAKAMFDQVITNGKTTDGKKYGLVPHFADIFRGSNENNEESIFAFQAAAGSGDVRNTNHDLAMNYPYNTGKNGPGECCGFYAPSFDLASSYRTNAEGLPLLDKSYRLPANELKTDQGLQSSAAFTPDQGPVDPRLDHTIGRRGIPFLDWGPHPGFSWIRDQSFAGPFTQKKYSYYKEDVGKFQDGGSWTPGYHAINFMIIRFADVLLMAAEAEVELGNLPTALGYVNQVRNRAAASPLEGTTVNYAISPYASFPDQEMARQAVRFERKLELALEGHRFFDLVRWGVAEQEINTFIEYERTKLPNNYQGARFTAGRDEVLPIPQRQIDLHGVENLKQNPNY